MSDQIEKNDDYWRSQLSEEEFSICRKKGTERPFTGVYWDCKSAGMYRCRCCKEPLFDAETKFDSGSGWPSFYAPVNEDCVGEIRDTSCGMIRIEIICRQCGSHLGHVFEDGPQPSGLRYCVNSASLSLEKKP